MVHYFQNLTRRWIESLKKRLAEVDWLEWYNSVGAMTETRIECPYCNEKILSSAQKCRFCREWLGKKGLWVDSYWDYFWYWLLALVIFWFLTSVVGVDFSNSPSPWLVLFLFADVLMGLFFFLSFVKKIVIAVIRKKREKELWHYGFVMVLVFFVFFGGLYMRLNAQGGSSSSVRNNDTPTPTAIATATTVVTKEDEMKEKYVKNNVVNKVDCVGPDGKVFKATFEKCEALNQSWGEEPNYMMDCNVHANCGGGTKRIQKKECDDSICCEIGGKWYFYRSKEKCNEDQNKYFSNNVQIPTLEPLPTYEPIPTTDLSIPTPYPTVKYSSPTPDMDYIQDQIDQCKSEVHSYYNNQVKSCSIKYQGSAVEMCEYAYNEQREEELKECENKYF